MRIRTCGIYRGLSPLLAPISHEGRVASHVVGVLLAVAALFLGTRSVLFFLHGIGAAKVIRVLAPPFHIGLPLLLLAALRSATGLLPLLEPRMGMKPTTTERTPPSREHAFLLLRTAYGETIRTDAGRREKK